MAPVAAGGSLSVVHRQARRGHTFSATDNGHRTPGDSPVLLTPAPVLMLRCLDRASNEPRGCRRKQRRARDL